MTKPVRYPFRNMTLVEAERQAKRMFGPTGAVRYFIKDGDGRKTHCMVGMVTDYEGQKAFGVIGEGGSWNKAFMDARVQWKKFKRAAEVK